jgi:hypothetical protein
MSTPPAHYDDLRALFINCTLKRSPQKSHTQGLVDAGAHIMRTHGVQPVRRFAPAPRPAEGRRRHPGVRQPALAVERRLPVDYENPEYR